MNDVGSDYVHTYVHLKELTKTTSSGIFLAKVCTKAQSPRESPFFTFSQLTFMEKDFAC